MLSRIKSRDILSIGPDAKKILTEHFWVFIGLAAGVAAFFAIFDLGNKTGFEEYAYLYTVDGLGTPEYIDRRPAVLLGLWVANLLVGPDPIRLFIIYALMKLVIAFGVYLLLNQFTENKFFSFSCAFVYTLYIIIDDYFLRSESMIITLTYVGFMIYGFYFYYRYVNGKSILNLVVGLLLGFLGLKTHTAVLAATTGIPILVYLIQRDFSRKKTIVLLSWQVMVGVASLQWILPLLGLGTVTYESGFLKGTQVTLGSVLKYSLIHLRIGLLDTLVVERKGIFEYQLQAIQIGIISVLVLFFINSYFLNKNDSLNAIPSNRRSYTIWIIVGVIATWLGFAPYLITTYVRGAERIHVSSVIAESIVFVAAIWLATSFITDLHRRNASRILLVSIVIALSSANVAVLQDFLYRFNADWETHAVFFRSMANQIPEVEDNTLFIYIPYPEDPAREPDYLDRLPVYYAPTFEYGTRYFYNDAASGIYPAAELQWVIAWEMDDEGVELTTHDKYKELPLDMPESFTWDEIIFVTKGDKEQVLILPDIPEAYYTEARAQQYDPYSRIKPGFVSDRIIELMPPVQKLPQ